MKSIILYESKTGTAEKVARLIGDNNNTKVQKVTTKLNINEFEKVVFVSPTYMGTVNKKIKKLIVSSTKPVTLVIVGTNTEGFKEMIEHNFDSETQKRLEIIHVGGAYNFERMNFFQKLVIKKMTGMTSSTDLVDYDTLNAITC